MELQTTEGRRVMANVRDLFVLRIEGPNGIMPVEVPLTDRERETVDRVIDAICRKLNLNNGTTQYDLKLFRVDTSFANVDQHPPELCIDGQEHDFRIFLEPAYHQSGITVEQCEKCYHRHSYDTSD